MRWWIRLLPVVAATLIAAGPQPASPAATRALSVGGMCAVEYHPGLMLALTACPDLETVIPNLATAPVPGFISSNCLVPGYDDRCESWGGDVYDSPAHDTDVTGDGGLLASRTGAVSPDGTTLYVAGMSDGVAGSAYEYDLATMAYNTETGDQRWVARYGGTAAQPHVRAYAVAVSPDGATVYTLGETFPIPATTCGNVVVAYDASTGAERWRYDRGGCSLIVAFSVAPDGDRVYIGGTGSVQIDGKARSSMFAAAIDASGNPGAVIWESHYPGTPDSLGLVGMTMALSADGQAVYVTGGEKRKDGLRKDYTTVAFDAGTGDIRWVAHDPLKQPEGFFGNNGAVAIAVSPDSSRVYVGGIDPWSSGTFTDPSESALLTYAHDATTGERLWGTRFMGAAGANDFHFVLTEGHLAASPDGKSVFVVGYHTTAATGGYMHGTNTLALDAGTGEVKWSMASRDPYRFCGYIGFYPAIATNGERVFVTSPRGDCAASRYVTLAYEAATGQQRWIGRYDRGTSLASNIATGPDGKQVYVVGTTKPIQNCIPFFCATLPIANSFDIVPVGYLAGPP